MLVIVDGSDTVTNLNPRLFEGGKRGSNGSQLVIQAFMHLKRWRDIATRYAKRLGSFVATVQVRCISLWLHIS